MTPPEPASAATAGRISEEIASIHAESYGEPVHAVRTHLLDDLVVTMLDIGLTTLERTLVSSGGDEDPVRRVRRDFQQAVGSTFIAAVEHHTGRRVVAFLSETHLDPSFVVEIFRLEPDGDGSDPR